MMYGNPLPQPLSFRRGVPEGRGEDMVKRTIETIKTILL
jgi:hypothetical protein